MALNSHIFSLFLFRSFWKFDDNWNGSYDQLVVRLTRLYSRMMPTGQAPINHCTNHMYVDGPAELPFAFLVTFKLRLELHSQSFLVEHLRTISSIYNKNNNVTIILFITTWATTLLPSVFCHLKELACYLISGLTSDTANWYVLSQAWNLQRQRVYTVTV